MGLMDALNKEDRVPVQFSTLYDIIYEAAKCQLLVNAVNANVPHGCIRGMLTGVEDDTMAQDDALSIEEKLQCIGGTNAALGISVGDTEDKS